ncbi:hypothetical protein BGX30_005111 [Mortierella sp. GBA39]|nr:hypothetical protein BGX30_005111 [Mortierella sp. GBA39]
MGVLDIICLTTDPDSTAFYGFAYAYSYDCSYCSYNVLVKSNANPTSGSTLTWSLVSKIDSKNITGTAVDMYAQFSCAINAQGVFTMFGWTRDSGGSYSNPEITYGVRYDPAGTMDANYNFQGSGAWMNVTIDKAYNWAGTSSQHILGYVNNGGTTDLVHTVLSGNENTIYVAKVDEATKILTAAGTWVLNKTMHGEVTAIGIGNNHLYTYGGLSSSFGSLCGGYLCLTGFPLATISPTTPVGKIYNASQVYPTFYSRGVYLYTYQNTLTLIASQISSSRNSTIYKINDPDNANSTGPPVANFTNSATDMDFFVPLGDGTSPTSFALMKQYGIMYVFGNDNGARYTHEINKVNITDPVGINPNPRTPSTGSSSSLGDSSSADAIIGVIAGVGFLLGLIVWLTMRGRTANATNATADKPLPSIPPLNNTNNYVYPPTTYPSGQPAPTTILPMAPITPVPQQHQTYQDQMQALQFSSHPRPNYVTTAYSTEPATFSPPVSYPGSSGAPQAAWQPTPFVPPKQPSSSINTPTLSANGSFVVATAFSSTAAAQSPQESQAIVSQHSVDSPTPSASTPLSSPPSVPHIPSLSSCWDITAIIVATIADNFREWESLTLSALQQIRMQQLSSDLLRWLQTERIPWFGQWRGYTCTMNAQGVFTMFGRYTSTTSLVGTTVPFGIRYDPAGTMELRVGYNGLGAWANISVTDGFSWSGPFSRHTLGYASGGADAMPVHASLSDTSNTITLATLNESTMTLAPMAVWNTYSGSYPSTLYTIKDPSTSLVLSSEVQFNADVVNMDHFVPIGTGSGASTFALIRRYKEMYAFGNDNGFRYTHLTKAVNVTDPARNNPHPPSLPQPTPESSSSSSSALSAGGIWGIAVGRYRNRRNRDNTINTAADRDQSVHDEDDDISVSSEKWETMADLIIYLYTPSAPAYPSDITQPSSQDSPEVERQESAELAIA